jgi:Zn finger protein HypA/HybF involved in hydrogenase expression
MEDNKRVCKVCQKPKDRVEAGRYNDRDKRFTDLNQKAWNGNVCPDCHRDRVKVAIAAKRHPQTI